MFRTSAERYSGFSTRNKSMLTVSAHEEYSGGFDRVILGKKKGMLMIVGTHTALGNAYTIYSSTYTRVPVPYIYIQNTMHSVQ